MEQIETIVKQKIILFSKNKCAACERAKEVLKEKNMNYEIITIEEHEEYVMQKARESRNAQMPFCEINGKIYNAQNTMEIINYIKQKESVEKNE